MKFALVSSSVTVGSRAFVMESGDRFWKRSAVVTVNKVENGPGPGSGSESEDEEKDKTKKDTDLDSVESKYLAKLEAVLANYRARGAKRIKLGDNVNSDLEVELYYNEDAKEQEKSGLLKVRDKGSNGVLARLLNACESLDNFDVDMKTQIKTKTHARHSHVEVKGANKAFVKVDALDRLEISGWFDFPENKRDRWGKKSSAVVMIQLTIILELNDKALDLIQMEQGQMAAEECWVGLRKGLLEEAESTGDVVILTGDGAEVRCHKMFLMTRVDVFKAMFQSGMKEAVDSKVEMKDMSERAVRALLAYLYSGDIIGALGCSDTAVELLLAADKYGIKDLYKSMKELILRKENVWFSVTAAIRLLWLARNKGTEKEEDGDDNKWIEKKAIRVLKSKPTEELRQSADFNDGFSNPQIAQELFIYLLQKD